MKCIMCGKNALETLGLCPECAKRGGAAVQDIKELQRTEDILGITQQTTKGVMKCIKSMIEITKEIEGAAVGEKEKIQRNKDDHI